MQWKFPKFKSGQLRRWEYLLPTGSAKETEHTVRKVLTDPYLPKMSTPFLKILPGKIMLENANFRQALEVLARIPWVRDFRLNLGMYPVKRTFDFQGFETALRKSEVLPKEWGLRFHPQIKGQSEWTLEDLRRLWETEHPNSENGNRTTEFSAVLLEDEIVLSLSFAGEPLNQRGKFKPLSKSAPIREDLAVFLIQRLHKILPNPDGLLVPFAGTGTFIREPLDSIFGIGFPHYQRTYLFQELGEFPISTWDFLKKKTLKEIKKNPIHVWWNDLNEETFQYNQERMKLYHEFIMESGLGDRIRFTEKQGDFFSLTPQEVWESMGKPKRIWMPLNPPYGVRMESNSTNGFYKKLGEKLKLWWELPVEISGLVLCPDEDSWSILIQRMGIKTETIHVTHGGMDLRVVYF
ncbi:hypothetical protein AB3N59_12250 [Leptospira sp. WS92.C1]